MTAQSKVGSLAASLKGKVAATYKHSTDLLIVLCVAAAAVLVAAPLVHHIWGFWHSVASVWAPQAPQKANVKRATP